jgi:hypothetical protein
MYELNNNMTKGDWSIISFDGGIVRAKLIHKSRGRFSIVDDNKDGKYIGRIVDAGDIIQVENKLTTT